jgi:hypothetical protein
MVVNTLIAYAPEEKPVVGCRGDARTSQPPRDGRYPGRPGLIPLPHRVKQRAFCDTLPGTVADATGGIASEYPTIRPERGERFPQRRFTGGIRGRWNSKTGKSQGSPDSQLPDTQLSVRSQMRGPSLDFHA